MTNKHYNGYCKATEEESDQRTPGKEIWRKKCGQQVSSTAGGRWSNSTSQSWMENKAVTYAPLGATKA